MAFRGAGAQAALTPHVFPRVDNTPALGDFIQASQTHEGWYHFH